MSSRLRQRVRELKTEARAVYLASKDSRVPWYAKLLAAAVIGYLDDLIIVPAGLLPAGLLLVVKLIPTPVMAECRNAVCAAE